MRQVIYSVAMSLDGYIAGPAGEFDWIPQEPEIDWVRFMARFDSVLVGRNTFEATLDQSAGASFPGMDVYVASRTLDPAGHAEVTGVTDRPEDLLSHLRAKPGKDIWLMGGGTLAKGLLESGLVDRIEVALIPLILGDGIPFLPPFDARISLSLAETKQYSSGILLLSYDVVWGTD